MIFIKTDNKLENIKPFEESIDDVTYYLVSLYYKTGCKYWCSRPKINRLLTIYKFCSILYNKNCLEGEYVIKENEYATVGLVFPKLGWNLLPRYVYLSGNFYEQNKEEITEPFYDFSLVPELYKVDDEVNDFSKSILEIIFRKFGNYSLKELGPMIDEIVSKMPVISTKYTNTIDTYRFDMFLDGELDNEVFNFVKSFRKPKLRKTKKLTK